jgi:hypothetical protein
VHDLGPPFEQPSNALDVGATLVGYLRPRGKFDWHESNVGIIDDFWV